MDDFVRVEEYGEGCVASFCSETLPNTIFYKIRLSVSEVWIWKESDGTYRIQRIVNWRRPKVELPLAHSHYYRCPDWFIDALDENCRYSIFQR